MSSLHFLRMVSYALVAARRALVPEPVYPETDLILPLLTLASVVVKEDEEGVPELLPKPLPPPLFDLLFDLFWAYSSAVVVMVTAPLPHGVFNDVC